MSEDRAAHYERGEDAGDGPQTYEAAAARIDEIIRRLDSGEASLNETLELVKEGKTLIELCARELEEVAGALQELRLDELVARLEGQSATIASRQSSAAAGEGHE